MTHAFAQDVPIGEDFYSRIKKGLGPELPKGLITHIAFELESGGLRYIDVWESKEDADRFTEERLHPVVHSLLAEVFGDSVPPEPPREPVNVIDVWGDVDLFKRG
jgi:hypothetical protein